jgi:hypothetical protein
LNAPARRSLKAPLIIGITVLAAVLYVASSLRRPQLDFFAPTPPHEQEAGDTLVGPVVYTVDAGAADVWQFFDFSRGSTVPRGEPLAWDLAFQRFHIIANGGPGFAGQGGIIDLGEVAFDSVLDVPAQGYIATTAGKDSTNSAILRWYSYGWASHLLRPKPHTWAVRTADGRHAKLQILSYYCPGATPGCITFRYVYQGGGGSKLMRARTP